MPTSRTLIKFIGGLVLLLSLGLFGRSSEDSLIQRSLIEKEFRNSDGLLYYRSPLRTPKNPGLPRFLMPQRNFIVNSHLDANIVFLIVHRSSSFTSLSNLTVAAKQIYNVLSKKRSVDFGHVQWAWSCMKNGRRLEGASGFTGDQEDTANELAMSGWGATAALLEFQDGYFETPWEIQAKAEGKSSEEIGVISFEVNEKSCSKLLSKYEKLRFKDHLRYFQLITGAAGNKFESVGKNCTKIAEEIFSEIENFPQEIFRKSETEISAPLSLFGFPDSPLPEKVRLSDYWKTLIQSQKSVLVDPSLVLSRIDFEGKKIKLRIQNPTQLFYVVKELPPVLDLTKEP